MTQVIDTSVIVIDVETTGIKQDTDQVVELAVQYGFELDGVTPPRRVWRFKPSVAIPAEATKIHGITDEMVTACQPFKIFAQRVCQLLARDERPLSVAWD